MPALLVAGVIGFVCGFMSALHWNIIDVRTPKERRSDARRWRRWRARRRKDAERFGVENVSRGG